MRGESYRSYDGISKNKQTISSDINEFVREKNRNSGKPHQMIDIKWLCDPPVADQDTAKQLLAKHEASDGHAVAARYYLAPEEAHSDKLDELSRIMDEKYERYRKISQHQYFDEEDNFVTCDSCGSKINTGRLGKRYLCPVCLSDLRSRPDIEEEKKAEQAFKESRKNWCTEKNAEEEHADKKIYWLVKFYCEP